MQFNLNITILPHEEGDQKLVEKKLNNALNAELKKIAAGDTIFQNTKFNFLLIKKSVDARHGKQKLCLRYKAFTNEESQSCVPQKIVWKKADSSKRVVIVGSGPAGLFAALKFLESGIQPVIIERGKTTSERKRDIAAISTRGAIDANSNYCFGEGGAGTFSDGKLFTRSDKRGDIHRIHRILCEFGADEKILTDSHPHIGTNKLPQIVNAIREKIILLGGEFYFETKCADLIVERDAVGKKIVRGIVGENIATGEQKEFLGDAVFLATGHSACDIYELLARVAPEALQAKTFSMGVRVEHPRELIDKIQYHRNPAAKNLGAAEYRLTAQSAGRGVYTFCMCPGGFVVPSATESQTIVLNGMSAAKRNSRWSNAAIVVETPPEDIPENFVKEARGAGCEALAGLYFRRHLERQTFLHGNGVSQAAPAQRLLDFLNERDSQNLPAVSYTPGVVASRLDEWLPPQITTRLKDGIKQFGKKMPGFVCDAAILLASETRTSTPARILRNRETFECEALRGLYPCGEGSGYAGGIVSSAMDGENAASQLTVEN